MGFSYLKVLFWDWCFGYVTAWIEGWRFGFCNFWLWVYVDFGVYLGGIGCYKSNFGIWVGFGCVVFEFCRFWYFGYVSDWWFVCQFWVSGLDLFIWCLVCGVAMNVGGILVKLFWYGLYGLVWLLWCLIVLTDSLFWWFGLFVYLVCWFVTWLLLTCAGWYSLGVWFVVLLEFWFWD